MKINDVPPALGLSPPLWSPAVGPEDITATRVILTTTSHVGLTAPVRLKSRNTE